MSTRINGVPGLRIDPSDLAFGVEPDLGYQVQRQRIIRQLFEGDLCEKGLRIVFGIGDQGHHGGSSNGYVYP
jgi:hypothetical protein